MRSARIGFTPFAVSFALLLCGSLSGCGTFFKQVGAAKAFSECKFRIKDVKNVTLGGTPASDLMKFSAIPTMWSQTLSQEQLWLKFTLVIEVRNPNPVRASMNKVDWILFLDEVEMVRSVLSEKIELPPGPVSIADFPMYIELDVKKVFSKESAAAWAKMAMSLSGMGDQKTKIHARIKPTIEIAGIDYELADYIDVNTEFSAEQGRELRQKLLTP